ncbi:TPA: DNA repair protein RadC [Citrobacter freundii]|nr:DNA repair protein RadC [Citrobacter freundii]
MAQQLPLFAATLSPAEQRTIRRALTLLESQLREPGAAFTSTAAVRDWLRLQLAGQERELFMVLYLDNQHGLLTYETLFKGTINHTQVHPREVVKSALKHNAAAVVVAHNHPSGDPEPSQGDRSITNRLKDVLALVDVKVLDHLVVGRDDIVSFAERGWL